MNASTEDAQDKLSWEIGNLNYDASITREAYKIARENGMALERAKFKALCSSNFAIKKPRNNEAD